MAETSYGGGAGGAPAFPNPAAYGAAAAYPHPVVNPLAVVGPQFCAPYPVDLVIVRKLLTLSEGNFGVTDVNGNIMFRVKGKLFSLRDRRILLDAAGNPLLTFQQKVHHHSRPVVLAISLVVSNLLLYFLPIFTSLVLNL